LQQLRTAIFELRDSLIIDRPFQKQRGQNLLLDRQAVLVAENWYYVSRVVIEIIVPGVLLNLHFALAQVLSVGCVNVKHQLLELRNYPVN
jgi:hypothetical protein